MSEPVSEEVDHPHHYVSHPSGIECITITEWFDFCGGNAFKYLFRRKMKGREVEDLRKAKWYCERMAALPASNYAEKAPHYEALDERIDTVYVSESENVAHAMYYIWQNQHGGPNAAKYAMAAIDYIGAEINRLLGAK